MMKLPPFFSRHYQCNKILGQISFSKNDRHKLYRNNVLTPTTESVSVFFDFSPSSLALRLSLVDFLLSFSIFLRFSSKALTNWWQSRCSVGSHVLSASRNPTHFSKYSVYWIWMIREMAIGQIKMNNFLSILFGLTYLSIFDPLVHNLFNNIFFAIWFRHFNCNCKKVVGLDQNFQFTRKPNHPIIYMKSNLPFNQNSLFRDTKIISDQLISIRIFYFCRFAR